ncbi:hypothetical protein [Clostridium butyricum]|uniref:hypothetical protein n=1 Tax=Clostridium butyricum TaxID=1492 RepID=UPI0022DEFE98|nr:hypothetical protein [Clostridium butyricum]
MRNSSNYGLKLMEGTDNVKRQDFVDNFTKIDTEMRAIENGGYPIVEATGTNTYIGATARIKSLGKGTKLTLFVSANANGNCSLNLNSYGSKNIKDSNGNIVINMKANIPYNLCYNGTDFILQGKGGGGNLIPKYLLAGYYGEGDNGRVDGTMANNGAVTSTLTAGTSYTIPAGYHNGSGKITANNLASQTGGSAGPLQILNQYSAWVNGERVVGAMPVMPTVGSNHANAGGVEYGAHTSGDSTPYLYLSMPQWTYTSTNAWLRYPATAVANKIGLTADKIVSGNNIMGINGTATVQSMGGAKVTNGNISTSVSTGGKIVIPSAGYIPSMVIFSTRIEGETSKNQSKMTLVCYNSGANCVKHIFNNSTPEEAFFTGYNGYGVSSNMFAERKYCLAKCIFNGDGSVQVTFETGSAYASDRNLLVRYVLIG